MVFHDCRVHVEIIYLVCVTLKSSEIVTSQLLENNEGGSGMLLSPKQFHVLLQVPLEGRTYNINCKQTHNTVNNLHVLIWIQPTHK